MRERPAVESNVYERCENNMRGRSPRARAHRYTGKLFSPIIFPETEPRKNRLAVDFSPVTIPFNVALSLSLLLPSFSRNGERH